MTHFLHLRSPAVAAPRIRARGTALLSTLMLATGLVALAPQAHADALTTLVGGGVGAVIGHSVGGRQGAVVGAVLGGVVGASVGQGNVYYESQPVYAVPVQPTYVYPTTYYAPAPVYYAPVWHGHGPYRGWQEVRYPVHYDRHDFRERHEERFEGRDWDHHDRHH